MCKNIIIVTNACEEGHPLYAEACWRQCRNRALECAYESHPWNTHCGEIIEHIREDDTRTPMLLHAKDAIRVSCDLCPLCSLRARHDNPDYERALQELATRRAEREWLQAELANLPEPGPADLQRRLDFYDILIDQLNYYAFNIEEAADKLRSALVQQEALGRVEKPGDPDQYYYGHQVTARNAFDPEGTVSPAHSPMHFPPEDLVNARIYRFFIMPANPEFWARDPAVDRNIDRRPNEVSSWDDDWDIRQTEEHQE